MRLEKLNKLIKKKSFFYIKFLINFDQLLFYNK